MKNESLKERLLLLALLVTGCLLRFRDIGLQSFWLDELHTVIEASPDLTWGDLWNTLKCCDPHPPVFFVVSKLFFYVFGSTEVIARSVSAIGGTVAIWAIYLLGRELYSVRIGLIAATLICFNHFHIFYSQEARPYSLAFLFTTLSFVFLVRLIKFPVKKHSILYALFTLLMMGSHHFGLFVFVSQLVIALVFWLLEKDEKKKLFIHLLISGLIIGVGYAPWLPLLFSMKAITSFWIQPTQPGFAIEYFYEYFGHSDLLKPFVLLFLASGLIHIFMKAEGSGENIKQNPLAMAFLICLIWITVSYFIPYLRSLLVVPMLHSRYTIVLLPAFMIILSFGLGLITNKLISFSVLLVFVSLSLTDLFLVKDYYKKVSKTQFRELGHFIASDSSGVYPVVANITSWHQQYYLKRFGYKGTILPGKIENTIDDLISKADGPNPPAGFWISDGHGAQVLTAETLKRLADKFVLVKSVDLMGVWARLYINPKVKDLILINHRSFSNPSQKLVSNGDTIVAIWDREAVTLPVSIPKGTYKVSAQLSGQPVLDVYPHLDVQINNRSIGTCDVTNLASNYNFEFKTDTAIQAQIRIVMTNDTVDAARKEDRNAFINSLLFLKSN